MNIRKTPTRIKDDETYFPVHYAAVMAYIELKKYDQANSLLDHMLCLCLIKIPGEGKDLYQESGYPYQGEEI